MSQKIRQAIPRARSSSVAQAMTLALTALTSACGGGAPLMHPAHPLAPGRLSAGAGSSGTLALGDASSSIDRARSVSAPGAAPSAGDEQSLAAGILAQGLYAPGVAPWLGLRLGLDQDNEAGILYSGRAARVDGRHAFDFGSTALSVGLGASALLARPPRVANDAEQNASGAGRVAVGVDGASPAGFGADLPLIFGYRSQAEILRAWGGLRCSFAHEGATLPARTDPTATGDDATADLSGSSLGATGLLGLSLGVSPVWASVEIDAGYQWMWGNIALPASGGGSERLSVSLAAPVVTVGGTLSTVF